MVIKSRPFALIGEGGVHVHPVLPLVTALFSNYSLIEKMEKILKLMMVVVRWGSTKQHETSLRLSPLNLGNSSSFL